MSEDASSTAAPAGALHPGRPGSHLHQVAGFRGHLRRGVRRGGHGLLLRLFHGYRPAPPKPLAAVAAPPGRGGHCAALPGVRYGGGPGHQLCAGGGAGEQAPAAAHRAAGVSLHHDHSSGGGLLWPGGGHPPDRRLHLLQNRPVDASGRQGQPGDYHVRHGGRLFCPVRHPPDGGHVRHGGHQRGGALLRRHGALRPLRHRGAVDGPALSRARHRLHPGGDPQPEPSHPPAGHRHAAWASCSPCCPSASAG